MLKKVLKAVGALVVLLIVLVAAWAAYISATWDKDYSAVEKPALVASTDPEVIKRGEYVVHSMAHCSVCHAPREVTLARKPGDHPAMPGGYRWDMGPMEPCSRATSPRTRRPASEPGRTQSWRAR